MGLLEMIAQPQIANIPAARARKRKSALEELLLKQKTKTSAARESKAVAEGLKITKDEAAMNALVDEMTGKPAPTATPTVEATEPTSSAPSDATDIVRVAEKDKTTTLRQALVKYPKLKVSRALIEASLRNPDGVETMLKNVGDVKLAQAVTMVQGLTIGASLEPGEAQNNAIQDAMEQVKDNPPLFQALTQLNRLPNEQKGGALMTMVQMLHGAGFAPMAKLEDTFQQKQDKVSVEKQKAATADANVLLREKEFALDVKKLNQQGKFKEAEQQIEEHKQKFGTIPSGYMQNPEKPSELLARPGGEPYKKEQEAKQKEKMTARAQIQTMDNVLTSIKKLKPKISNWTAGMGSLINAVPGTPAYNVSSELETLGSNLAIEELIRMKQSSTTGASGFGQLSEKELSLLLNKLRSLKQGQSPPQLLQNLVEIEDIWQGQRALIDEAVLEMSPVNDASKVTSMSDSQLLEALNAK